MLPNFSFLMAFFSGDLIPRECDTQGPQNFIKTAVPFFIEALKEDIANPLKLVSSTLYDWLSSS
jgi:hypothetical protein